MASFITAQHQVDGVDDGDYNYYNHDSNHINWPTLESLIENTNTTDTNTNITTTATNNTNNGCNITYTNIDVSQMLISDERIPSDDEDWPQEEFPGITRFPKAEPSASLQIDGNDFALINSLANLAPGVLIDEMKAMHTIACELADEEAHERARGKILRVLLD